MNWLERIYCHIWFYSTPWIDKNLRRPFTFVFRDCINRYPYIGVPLIFVLGAVFAYLVYLNILWIILTASYWLLVGHVTWGAKYVPDEQEPDPPIIDP